ncbi:hypothetical protein BJY01DRAFT_184163 [Aspergillus pseudoustus]|uniref:Uncharacterized protein n=1 Tax=Aspergillus pseudoustus TaxID=1810923 RepID=A0ABR4JZ38_9EURO
MSPPRLSWLVNRQCWLANLICFIASADMVEQSGVIPRFVNAIRVSDLAGALARHFFPRSTEAATLYHSGHSWPGHRYLKPVWGYDENHRNLNYRRTAMVGPFQALRGAWTGSMELTGMSRLYKNGGKSVARRLAVCSMLAPCFNPLGRM